MPRTAALGYHEVTDNVFDSGFQRPLAMRYKHTTAAFRAHLETIAAGRRAPELVTGIDFGRPSTHLLLTFDDGGASAVLPTADLLEELGLKGLFFIATDYIGTKTFLSGDDVRALHRRGHGIGSHSASHPLRMAACSAAELDAAAAGCSAAGIGRGRCAGAARRRSAFGR